MSSALPSDIRCSVPQAKANKLIGLTVVTCRVQIGLAIPAAISCSSILVNFALPFLNANRQESLLLVLGMLHLKKSFTSENERVCANARVCIPGSNKPATSRQQASGQASERASEQTRCAMLSGFTDPPSLSRLKILHAWRANPRRNSNIHMR